MMDVIQEVPEEYEESKTSTPVLDDGFILETKKSDLRAYYNDFASEANPWSKSLSGSGSKFDILHTAISDTDKLALQRQNSDMEAYLRDCASTDNSKRFDSTTETLKEDDDEENEEVYTYTDSLNNSFKSKDEESDSNDPRTEFATGKSKSRVMKPQKSDSSIASSKISSESSGSRLMQTTESRKRQIKLLEAEKNKKRLGDVKKPKKMAPPSEHLLQATKSRAKAKEETVEELKQHQAEKNKFPPKPRQTGIPRAAERFKPPEPKKTRVSESRLLELSQPKQRNSIKRKSEEIPRNRNSLSSVKSDNNSTNNQKKPSYKPSASLMRSTVVHQRAIIELQEKKEQKEEEERKKEQLRSLIPKKGKKTVPRVSSHLALPTANLMNSKKEWEENKGKIKQEDDIWWEKRKTHDKAKPMNHVQSKLFEPTKSSIEAKRLKLSARTPEKEKTKAFIKIDKDSPLLRPSRVIQPQLPPPPPELHLETKISTIAPKNVQSKLRQETAATTTARWKSKEEREAEKPKVDVSKIKPPSKRLSSYNESMKLKSRGKLDKGTPDERETGWTKSYHKAEIPPPPERKTPSRLPRRSPKATGTPTSTTKGKNPSTSSSPLRSPNRLSELSETDKELAKTLSFSRSPSMVRRQSQGDFDDDQSEVGRDLDLFELGFIEGAKAAKNALEKGGNPDVSLSEVVAADGVASPERVSDLEE